MRIQESKSLILRSIHLGVLSMAIAGGVTFAFGQSGVSNKVALLVGISHYANDTGWDSLHTRRDVEAVSVVLQRHGFNDLRMLQDEAATKAQVVASMQALNPAKGASVVVFFSGHGQQLQDNDDLDYEPDGQDEALALYDSPSEFPSSYRGEHHLRDDELHGLIDIIRAKIGPQGEVLLLVDACFSGTIDRGPIYALPPIRSSSAVTKNAMTRLEGTGLEDGRDERVPATSKGELGALTVITGSRADEQSREVLNDQQQLMGSLSLAFCMSMEKAEPTMTYRGLFQHIQHFMIQKGCISQPQMHGDPDRLLFQGRALDRVRQILVLQQLGPDTVLLDVGTIGGLTVGSKVGLFPAETRAPLTTAMIVEGEVVEATAFHAKVVWRAPVWPALLANNWILVTEKRFDHFCPRVKLECGESGLCRLAAAQLRGSGMVELVDANPELLLTGGDELLVLQSERGDTLYDSRNERGDSTRRVRMLEKRLLQCLQAKCMRKTVFSDAHYAIDPFVILTSDSLNLSHRQEFKMGDNFYVGGIHKGTRPAYYNIVYLEEWKATLLAPWDGGGLDQLLVQPGERFLAAMPYEFTKERQRYWGVFKIIASEAPLDLRGIVDWAEDVRGNDMRNYSSLEWMIRYAIRDKQQRSAGMAVELALIRAWTAEVEVTIEIEDTLK